MRILFIFLALNSVYYGPGQLPALNPESTSPPNELQNACNQSALRRRNSQPLDMPRLRTMSIARIFIAFFFNKETAEQKELKNTSSAQSDTSACKGYILTTQYCRILNTISVTHLGNSSAYITTQHDDSSILSGLVRWGYPNRPNVEDIQVDQRETLKEKFEQCKVAIQEQVEIYKSTLTAAQGNPAQTEKCLNRITLQKYQDQISQMIDELSNTDDSSRQRHDQLYKSIENDTEISDEMAAEAAEAAASVESTSASAASSSIDASSSTQAPITARKSSLKNNSGSNAGDLRVSWNDQISVETAGDLIMLTDAERAGRTQIIRELKATIQNERLSCEDEPGLSFDLGLAWENMYKAEEITAGHQVYQDIAKTVQRNTDCWKRAKQVYKHFPHEFWTQQVHDVFQPNSTIETQRKAIEMITTEYGCIIALGSIISIDLFIYEQAQIQYHNLPDNKKVDIQDLNKALHGKLQELGRVQAKETLNGVIKSADTLIQRYQKQYDIYQQVDKLSRRMIGRIQKIYAKMATQQMLIEIYERAAVSELKGRSAAKMERHMSIVDNAEYAQQAAQAMLVEVYCKAIEKENAATKIQAAFRDNQARSRLKTTNTVTQTVPADNINAGTTATTETQTDSSGPLTDQKISEMERIWREVISELQEKLNEACKRSEEDRKRLQEIHTQLTTANARSEDKDRAIEEMREKHEEIQKKNDRLIDVAWNQVQKIQSLKDEVLRLLQIIQLNIDEARAWSDTMRQDSLRRVTDLKTDKKELQEKVQEQLQKHNKNLEILNQRLSDSQAAYEQLSDELERAKNSTSQNVAAFDALMEGLKTRNLEAIAEINRLHDEIAVLKNSKLDEQAAAAAAASSPIMRAAYSTLKVHSELMNNTSASGSGSNSPGNKEMQSISPPPLPPPASLKYQDAVIQTDKEELHVTVNVGRGADQVTADAETTTNIPSLADKAIQTTPTLTTSATQTDTTDPIDPEVYADNAPTSMTAAPETDLPSNTPPSKKKTTGPIDQDVLRWFRAAQVSAETAPTRLTPDTTDTGTSPEAPHIAHRSGPARKSYNRTYHPTYATSPTNLTAAITPLVTSHEPSLSKPSDTNNINITPSLPAISTIQLTIFTLLYFMLNMTAFHLFHQLPRFHLFSKTPRFSLINHFSRFKF